ncbi:Spy/CpxP family protein refolding chaperone [Glaciecola sp. SC05]|uniref:Spy/CpxP family protein refolding chaperone n=1 Tax=Glaciecola sp. SC05 TaxID=1987355 RepID=UPI003529876E
MKPTLLAVTLVFSLAASQLPSAYAHGPENGQRGEHKLFASLNLSESQKQDIGEILKQSKQNNAVYKGERQAIVAQMRNLMDMPTWDQSLAEDIVSQRVAHAGQMKLNKATAQHQAYNLLDETQQAALLDKQSKRQSKDNKRESFNIKRLEKRLGLSAEQVTAIEQIQETHKLQSKTLNADLKSAREAEKAIIFASTFDQDAWLNLQNEAQASRVEFALTRSYAHYQMLSVLDDEQKAKFEKMLNRAAKGKRGNKGNKGKSSRQNTDQA